MDVLQLVAWNKSILAAAEAEDGFLTLKGVRTAAMAHIAMHEALEQLHAGNENDAFSAPAAVTSATAAISEAGYTVAAEQYPKLLDQWQVEKQKWLAGLSDPASVRRGLETGHATATAVLQSRQGDGWDGEAEYLWHPMAPGVYAEFNDHSDTPQGFIFGAGWARVKPFVLVKSSQFRSPPPPAINSQDYTVAFNEVKSVGARKSSTRTTDQTHLALWWKDFVDNSHNRLARDLVVRRTPPVLAAARMFALLNISIFDAYISVFDNKFFYNHWRPYTAIRRADRDGNPATSVDQKWTNTHNHTYAFPSYPSAHGTACAAAMTVLADTFKADTAFEMFTPEVDVAGPFSGKIKMTPATRSFASFQAAAMECSLSRVYLGIHFRYDSVAGNELGKQVGNHILDNYRQ